MGLERYVGGRPRSAQREVEAGAQNEGAQKMTHLVKYLPRKHGDLNSDPRTRVKGIAKQQGLVACSCNPCVERKRDNSLGLLDSQLNLLGSSSRSMRNPMAKSDEDTRGHPLASTPVCRHNPPLTHSHAHKNENKT